MQRNWIGRSEGIDITFEVMHETPLTIYTTSPETLFGVTYLAIAPEHPLALKYAANDQTLMQFIADHRHMKVSEATLATIEKKGMPLPLTAKHPLTQQTLPIWVANFVVMDYGAGAVMAVPAHDERDQRFAGTQWPTSQTLL